jgi:hypothetical protein
MRFGTWNVRSLYRSASLTTAARELASCKLGLVVRCDKEGTEGGGNIIFYMEQEVKISIGNRNFVQHRIVSAVK